MKFKIYAGLGGGFGGVNYLETIECDSTEDAEQIAFERACEIYDSYAGLHGLRDGQQIIEEDLQGEEYEDISENELYQIAEEIFCEERESWLTYYVEEVTGESEEQQDLSWLDDEPERITDETQEDDDN